MTKEESIAKAVGVSVGKFPNEIAKMLIQTGVSLDAESYNIDQLVDSVFSGLHTSPKFNASFLSFLQEKANELND